METILNAGFGFSDIDFRQLQITMTLTLRLHWRSEISDPITFSSDLQCKRIKNLLSLHFILMICSSFSFLVSHWLKTGYCSFVSLLSRERSNFISTVNTKNEEFDQVITVNGGQISNMQPLKTRTSINNL